LDNQEGFFLRLTELFNEFGKCFTVDTVKKCKDCFYCCSSKMVFSALYPLERDFINKHITESSTGVSCKEFEAYLLFRNLSVCPFYIPLLGCGIYNVRPLFCRIFGQVEFYTPVPHFCIYSDEKIFSYRDAEKFLNEYKLLNIDYTKYKLSYCKDEEERFFLLLELGVVQMLLSQFSEAHKNFLLALPLKPDDRSVYFNLGWSSLELKEFQKAIDYFLKSLELGGGNSSYTNNYEKQAFIHIYNKLACAYFGLSEWNKAGEAYDKSIKINPRNIIPHIGKYFIYDQTGQKAEAEKKLRWLKMKFPGDKDIQKIILHKQEISEKLSSNITDH
jgi:tetratricopeptide (TPR) repeat protein